jgi:hypothetical protein
MNQNHADARRLLRVLRAAPPTLDGLKGTHSVPASTMNAIVDQHFRMLNTLKGIKESAPMRSSISHLLLSEEYSECCETIHAIETDGCFTCANILPGSLAPTHNGSKRCQSGSIASGGDNAHCSCDICF